MHTSDISVIGGAGVWPLSLVGLLFVPGRRLEHERHLELEVLVGEHHALLVELTLPPALGAGGRLAREGHVRMTGTWPKHVDELVDVPRIDLCHL